MGRVVGWGARGIPWGGILGPACLAPRRLAAAWRLRREGGEIALDRISHRGGRETNQDACFTSLVDGGKVVVVVADGVSAVLHGGDAARLAASVVGEALVALAGRWTRESIREAVLESNRRLLHLEPAGEYQTTLVGLALDAEAQGGFCFHSGDSWAACLDREGRYRPLTRSHSEAARLFDRGVAGRLGARILGGAATRGLGCDHHPPVEVEPVEARPGWRFVAATDGVDRLQEREVPSVLRRANPYLAAHELFARAHARGLGDNVTVVTVALPPHRHRLIPALEWSRRLDWAAALVLGGALAAVVALDAGVASLGPAHPVASPPSTEAATLGRAAVPTAQLAPTPIATAGAALRRPTATVGTSRPAGSRQEQGGVRRPDPTATPAPTETTVAEEAARSEDPEEDQDP